MFKKIKRWWLTQQILNDFEKNYIFASINVEEFNRKIEEGNRAYDINTAQQEEKEAKLEQAKDLLKNVTGEAYDKTREEIDVLNAEISMFEERNNHYIKNDKLIMEAARGEARKDRAEKYEVWQRYLGIIKNGKVKI